MMSAAMLQALQCNTSPRVHPPYFLSAPTLLRHRPPVSPPFTTAALDIGHMPLSHHAMQYRCVLLDQSRFRGMLHYIIIRVPIACAYYYIMYLFSPYQW
jgi:hypothetical protein